MIRRRQLERSMRRDPPSQPRYRGRLGELERALNVAAVLVGSRMNSTLEISVQITGAAEMYHDCLDTNLRLNLINRNSQELRSCSSSSCSTPFQMGTL
jgi:hypothetical protein